MTDQLSLYNGALAVLGARKLANLSENREPRHKLDDIWARDLVERCLQAGQWNFATRSMQPAISSSVTPAFGYTNAFEKPTDFVRTTGISTDEYFKQPLTQYTDEAGFWFADEDVIYIRYVSNDTQWGFDFSLWPYNFARFVEHFLAVEVAPRLTGIDKSAADLKGELKNAKKAAKATDAMEEPPAFPPPGTWVRARWGNVGGDRGSRNKLTG